MKKFIILALAGAGAVFATSAQSKFDAQGRMIINDYQTLQANPGISLGNTDYMPFSFETASRAGSKVPVFVTLAPGATAADLEARGFEIALDLDDLVLANGTLEDIAALEDCDFVKALSFGERRTPMLDLARKGTGIDIIHDGGSGLPGSFKGAGVFTAIFDTGLDPNHANFRNSDGSSRVKALWNFSGVGIGNEYIGDNVLRFTTDLSTETHGTHTTGCMAGSFNRRGGGQVSVWNGTAGVASARNYNPYYGMAPEADILISCGELYDANITTGVANMINYAQAQGKPVVVNLSIGSNVGPHDGSDQFCQMLDRLGERAIICISAGNEGDVNMSVDKVFTSADNSFATFFAPMGNQGTGSISIYSDSSTPFDTEIIIYDTSTGNTLSSQTVNGGSEQSVTIATPGIGDSNTIRDLNFNRAFTSSSVRIATSRNAGTNNRFSARLTMSLNVNQASNQTRRYALGIRIKGAAGQHIQMATNSNDAEFSSLGQSGFINGNSDFSISSMACGFKTLCVGAWNTRKEIPVLGSGKTGGTMAYQDNSGFEVNEIAGYSSYGTLHDGRTMPAVCAPGSGIISSISTYLVDVAPSNYIYSCSASQKYLDRDNYWEVMQGTSMASPVVAGGIALWLQADPTLTVDDVKKIIASTSTKDQYVASEANPVRWGAGKFNALEGLKEVIKNSEAVTDVAVGESEFFFTPDGAGNWNIFDAAATSISVNVFDTQGRPVKNFTEQGNSATVSTEGLTSGIYIVNVNGRYSQRIAVR